MSEECPLAEQFVAQELLAFAKEHHYYQKLCYWLREGKRGNAEVDFVTQMGTKIVPIKVKAGAAGSLKSLLQMIAQKKLKQALKIDLNMPTQREINHEIVTEGAMVAEVNYQLTSIPPYLLTRVLNQDYNGE